MALNHRYNKNQRRLMSEINVTPFVDVMLVLLVVFMITAPLLQTGVELDLPNTETPNLPEIEKPLIISINKQNEIFLSESRLKIKTLSSKLEYIKKNNSKVSIYLRADKEVKYDLIMAVLKEIIEAGIINVSLITDPKG
tara:strand:- start:811 stop:1227 length:417 start_codon:yes stop_codon:yes gene_type:complete